MLYTNKDFGIIIREFKALNHLEDTFPASYYRHYKDHIYQSIVSTDVHLYIDTTSIDETP